MSAPTTDDTLTSVREAAEQAASARERLESAIRNARVAGVSLRKISEAAGMNHETVRTIAKNDS